MTITFALLAHNQTKEALVSIGSIACQTNPNWKIMVINNGPNPNLQYIVEELAGGNKNQIVYAETKEFVDTDTYNRELAFQCSGSEFTICASIADYFLPTLVHDILYRLQEDPKDLIIWNGYNHHGSHNTVMEVEPRCRNIDWCNFAVRTELARQIPIRHGEAMADGYFVEDLMKHESKPTVEKIGKMLVVHT